MAANDDGPWGRMSHHFYNLDQQLGHGLQVFLEYEGVPKETRGRVAAYMDDVMKGVRELEADVAALGKGRTPPRPSREVEPDLDR